MDDPDIRRDIGVKGDWQTRFIIAFFNSIIFLVVVTIFIFLLFALINLEYSYETSQGLTGLVVSSILKSTTDKNMVVNSPTATCVAKICTGNNPDIQQRDLFS